MPEAAKPAGNLVVFSLLVVVLPLLVAWGAGLALEQNWLTPTCTTRCEARGATLVFVTPGHKSGKPPAGCLCSDGATEPWSGPRWVGVAQVVVFLGLATGFMGLWSTQRKSEETPD
jgi:hypothetical protein